MFIIYISISDQNKKSVIGTYNPIFALLALIYIGYLLLSSDFEYGLIILIYIMPTAGIFKWTSSATSFFTPIAANTIPKFPFSSPEIFACLAICTASSLCFIPAPEKIGNF